MWILECTDGHPSRNFHCQLLIKRHMQGSQTLVPSYHKKETGLLFFLPCLELIMGVEMINQQQQNYQLLVNCSRANPSCFGTRTGNTQMAFCSTKTNETSGSLFNDMEKTSEAAASLYLMLRLAQNQYLLSLFLKPLQYLLGKEEVFLSCFIVSS